MEKTLESENVSPSTREVIKRSIAKFKQLERIQEESERQYFDVFNSMIDPIHVIDRDMRFALLNKAFQKWNKDLGLDTNVLGKSIREVFPFLSEGAMDEYHQIFKTGEILSLERTSEENKNYFSIQKIPIYESGSLEQKVTRIVTVIRNITKHKETLQALQESEEKYRSLITTMGEGVWVSDIDNKTILVNPALVDMLGYTKEELLDRSVTEFLSPESLLKFKKVNNHRFIEGIFSSTKYELQFIKKSGDTIVTKVVGTPLHNEQNEIIGSFGVLSDITQEKKLQELQERFIAVTSHELRTPLTIIKGYFDFLRHQPDISQNKIDEIYSSISNNIQRLNRLVESVHDLAKIQANIFEIIPESINLPEFITEVKKQIQILYPEKIVFIDFNSSENIEQTVTFDKDRIIQVLENLVDNAIKNSPIEKPVNVSINLYADVLNISVEDFGAGIPNAHLFQLFQPFSHIPSPYSDKGAGLGLYIVKVIIEAHGGSIELITQENKGCIFSITIPAILTLK
ncbi:MAG: PAS domain S-box protein [Candidatus Hodarchaeota archaeon]